MTIKVAYRTGTGLGLSRNGSFHMIGLFTPTGDSGKGEAVHFWTVPFPWFQGRKKDCFYIMQYVIVDMFMTIQHTSAVKKKSHLCMFLCVLCVLYILCPCRLVPL